MGKPCGGCFAPLNMTGMGQGMREWNVRAYTLCRDAARHVSTWHMLTPSARSPGFIGGA